MEMKAIMKVEAGPGIALRRVPVPEPGLEEVLARLSQLEGSECSK